MSTTINNIRINNVDPEIVDVYTKLHPFFSWDFESNAASIAQHAFEIKIGTYNRYVGSELFEGNIVSSVVESTVSSYEYTNYDLKRGTTYYGQVRAWDSEFVLDVDTSQNRKHLSNWLTFSFKVNQLPYVTNAKISPSHPFSSEDLSVSYKYIDADSHEEFGTKIRWYKFGVLQESFNDLQTLPSKNITIGDTWSAKIIPFDGLEYGVPSETNAVEIESSPAEFTTLEILPADPNIHDLLKVNYEFDNSNPYLNPDSVIVDFVWYVNDVEQTETGQTVRLSLAKDDVVKAKLKISYLGSIISESETDEVTISDASWKIFDLKVNGYKEPIGLTDLAPLVTWKVFKSQETSKELPAYFRLLITKTPSLQTPVFDTGAIEYTTNSYQIEDLDRGQTYFVHVGVGDTSSDLLYETIEIVTSGSSWKENVLNNVGWTVEFKFKLVDSADTNFQSVSIHDGTKFCLLSLYKNKIKFFSVDEYEYDIPTENPFTEFQVVRITGFNSDCQLYFNNNLALDLSGKLNSLSQAKRLEFGDMNPAIATSGVWSFFRYSTSGAFNVDTLSDDNDFDFYEVVNIQNGSIEDFKNGFIAWNPDSSSDSSVIFTLNENSKEVVLPTVNRNFSPITSIFIDKNNNKYIASANGIRALYGSKHEPDYFLDTSLGTLTISDFDVISNIEESDLSDVQYFSNDSLYIDTTASNINEYDPSSVSHTIHYLSQRAPGHKWFDNVDNAKGWQVELTFNLLKLEQEPFVEDDLTKDGVGIYINDGAHQETITFSQNSITLQNANIFVNVNASLTRVYRIVGQGNNIKIYQRLASVSAGNEQLLLDGTGLFTETATPAANSRKPKMAVDSDNNYHAVWGDDSGGKGSILYSKFSGGEWGKTEVVVESAAFTLKNPDIYINTDNNIYVVYEDLSYNRPEISVSIKDTVGWNPKIRLTSINSKKNGPKITGDSFGNIYVVWEDDRNGHSELFCAIRNKQLLAWNSSAQFGNDTNIVSYTTKDLNLKNKSVDFRNPSLVFAYPKVYVAFEADFGDSSAIYVSTFDILAKDWFSSGFPQFKTDGTLSGTGTSILVSDLERNCVKPDITTATTSQVVIVWEDRTEKVAQIWGKALFVADDSELTPATQVTHRSVSCRNPVVSSIIPNDSVSIFFESYNKIVSSNEVIDIIGTDEGTKIDYNELGEIFHSSYNGVSGIFFGSATGFDDDVVLTGNDNKAFNPAAVKKSASSSFIITYDYFKNSGDTTLESKEHPEFYLIGDATVTDDTGLNSVSFETNSTSTVSILNTKEFAIGDISDSLSTKMQIKNLKMYFGYSDKPLSVLAINESSAPTWPDDRVFDVFADVTGGILSGTFSGLTYFNTKDSSIKLIPLETGKTNFTITAINYSKNGIWFVGTDTAVYFSVDGGQNWSSQALDYVQEIAMDSNGNAVVVTVSGIYTISINIAQNTVSSLTPRILRTNLRTVAVDENDIIWAGGDDGLIRIDENNSVISFNSSNGLSSNHVNDIVIVNKANRFIATANGINKMSGFAFEAINTSTHDIGSNNILSLAYNSTTKSLWFSALNKLYEMTFRDPGTDRIPDEIEEYDTEISLNESYDKSTYFILDTDLLVSDGTTLEINSESSKVYINKNLIEFGYTIDSKNKSIVFDADIKPDDIVEIQISNKLKVFKDFDQNKIEKEISGEYKTVISKLAITSQGQLLALSNSQNSSLFAHAGTASIPFTITTIDRDKPAACLQLVDQLSKSKFRFKVLASDETTNVDKMIVSIYDNFTSDGETPLDYVPYSQFVVQDIGETLNEFSTSLDIPSTATIGTNEYSVGKGKFLATLTFGQVTYIYAITSSPVIVFRMNTAEEVWTPICAIANGSSDIKVNAVETVSNALYIMTGSSTQSNRGQIYKCADGENFITVGTIGNNANCLTVSQDNTIFFGNDAGTIYSYTNGSLSQSYTGIGATINSLGVIENSLIAATGNSGRLYLISMETGDVSIIYQSKETNISDLLISDTIFISGSDSSIVYSSDLKDFSFEKDYQSITGNTLKLYSVDTTSVTDVLET